MVEPQDSILRFLADEARNATLISDGFALKAKEIKSKMARIVSGEDALKVLRGD